MIYFFQSLSLKIRFLGVLLWIFPVLGFWWLLQGAPWALASLHLISGGRGLPDQQFWVPPSALQALFDAWGPDGRTLYLTVLAPTQLGFLLAYGVFLTTATLYLLKKANPAGPWWYLLPLVPLAASALDFLQAATVALLLVLPGDDWDAVFWAASVFLAAKAAAVGASVTVLMGGTVVSMVRLGWSKVRGVIGHRADR